MMAPVTLQHAKENNFAQFARLIDSMENRYMNVGSDGIVDINSLQVIRTRSGRVSKPRLTTPNVSTEKKSRRGRPPKVSYPDSRPSLSPIVTPSSQSGSSFEQTSGDSIQSLNLNFASILFDRSAQREASKKLLAILKAGGPAAAKTASNLFDRCLIVSGRDTLPNKANVRPFFTFEEQDIGVTFLFDTPDLTPWTLICLKFFGEENLDLYQQIYKFVLVEGALRSNDNSKKTLTQNVRPPATSITDYFALVPYHQNDPKRMEIDEDDLENLNTQQTTHHSRSSMQVESSRTSSSSLSSAYISSLSSIPIYHPSIESIVYENDKQLVSLRKLLEILRQSNDESRQVKRKLIARAAKALGFDSMPYGRNVLPFFTFHEKGEIGVSFLFDIETLSPWTTICQLYYGKEILEACKDIYQMINQPDIESLLKLERLSRSFNSLGPAPPKNMRNSISQEKHQSNVSTPILRSSRSCPVTCQPINKNTVYGRRNIHRARKSFNNSNGRQYDNAD